MRKDIKNFGFSLVELSVVLTIIGITLAGALELATKKTEANKLEETEARMDMIEDALASFLLKNQRLPCPADGSDVISEQNFGKEGSATALSCSGANASSGDMYFGVVPVKTLNLPDIALIDGWDHRFSYAVDLNFANNVTTNSDCGSDTGDTDVCFVEKGAGSLTIGGQAGVDITTEAIYVLISHGANGNGAYTYYGSATKLGASSDADEQKNHQNSVGTVFVNKLHSSSFDDILRYKTKWQIVDDMNGITDESLCKLAVNVPSNDEVCKDASNETTCQNLASQVSKLCFDR